MKKIIFLFVLVFGFALTILASTSNPSTPANNGNGTNPVFNVILPIGGIALNTGDTNITVTKKDSIIPKGATIAKKKLIYKFDLMEEIGPPTWRQTQAAFKQAKEVNADYILIHMNTYGGAVDAADNIRTKILNSEVPVLVYIDNNAASAGALISIACDSIYMRTGSNIGAATVVDGEGKPQPEKYQSYMRSMLRATAEATGRDPKIAEAMNDPRISIIGVNDSGKVLTFTVNEAIKNGYCQGKAESVEEVFTDAGINDYKIIEYKKTTIESIIDLLLKPFVSGILIMIIIGGIYFELQTPGVGFPLFAAITAAILYFAPLYLEGLAANWEILLFVIGVVLVVIELVAIPGFGFIGITGIVFIILGLSLSLVGALPSSNPIDLPESDNFLDALLQVIVSIILSLAISFYVASKILETSFFSKFVLSTSQESNQGYVSADLSEINLVGKIATAFTILRPSGKVELNGEIYDATAETSFIEKGDKIQVVKFENNQLVVRKV